MLDESNYYTDKTYLDATAIKGYIDCPARQLAIDEGRFIPDSDARALIVGGYVDAMSDGKDALDRFIIEHRPQLYTKTGAKRADIQAADAMYNRAFSEPVFRHYMSGEHQRIMTGFIPCDDGLQIPVKIKMDSYKPGEFITDLKTCKSLEPVWKDGEKMTVPAAYKWDIQLALYRWVESQNSENGELLPCYLTVVTKEQPEPRVEVIKLEPDVLDNAWQVILHWAPLIYQYKKHLIEAPRCEKCDYCYQSHHIDEPMSYYELLKKL